MLEEAFLQDILANPDDEVARLIYADWLSEQADPERVARGEFIHMQCQLARDERTLASWEEWAELAHRLPELRAREVSLLAQYREQWDRPLRGLVQRYEFRRGFIEDVSLAPSAFLQRGADLFRLAPVRRVEFIRGDLAMTQLAGCPLLERLRGLRFTYYLGNAGLAALLSSRHLTQLRELGLHGVSLGDDGVRTLAGSPVLGRLTHLDLSHNGLTVEGVRTLFRSRHWGAMESLNLAGNTRIAESELESLASIAESPDGRRLAGALQLFGSPPPLFRNAHARRLAERSRESASQAATVVSEGLSDAHRRVRAAAAQLLGNLGTNALASLPSLVRRLYDRGPNGRDHTVFNCAATSLVRLLPALPEGMRNWLGVLANPLRSAENNLRVALENRNLPRSVWEQFSALCCRRRVWWDRVLDQEAAVPRLVEPVYPDHGALGRLVREVIRLGGGEKEAAWLLTRLCELLQRQVKDGGSS